MKTSKKSEAMAHIAKLSIIDVPSWEELKLNLHPISESYLRTLARNSGKPLSPLVEGVRTQPPEEARRTLLALSDEYTRGDASVKRQCRNLVIEAKRRLRARLARSESSETRELLLWVSIWLENPPLFSDWLILRERRSGCLIRTE